jgi:hypothetical protein
MQLMLMPAQLVLAQLMLMLAQLVLAQLMPMLARQVLMLAQLLLMLTCCSSPIQATIRPRSSVIQSPGAVSAVIQKRIGHDLVWLEMPIVFIIFSTVKARSITRPAVAFDDGRVRNDTWLGGKQAQRKSTRGAVVQHVVNFLVVDVYEPCIDSRDAAHLGPQ